MKKTVLYILALIIFLPAAKSQNSLLKVGSRFPDIMITNISNAPVKEFYLNKATGNKLYILNFWGTWCSPCIPEMDSLAKLQKQNTGKIQVIAISDDNEKRKAAYLKNRPSDIWLATDTSYTLYNMLNLAFVGQSAIVNADKEIVALVRTDSINQRMIDMILRGDIVTMSAGIKEAMLPANDDAFGVDSLMAHSFTLRGYKKGQQTMGRRYLDGVFKGRRISWHNVSMAVLYREAYHIKSDVQERYEHSLTEKDISDFENKQTLYSMDLLVRPEQKDSLHFFLQKYLNQHLPVKARVDKDSINVFVLKLKQKGALLINPSVAEETSRGFSGRGYNGIKVLLSDFAGDYLTNELGLPVVDETGLTGFYDIKTEVEQRDRAGILRSIEALGFTIEKTKRQMPVLIYYRD